MKQRSLSLASILLLAGLPVLVSAQETSGIEDERMQEIAKHNEEEWQGPRSKVTVGFRVLNSGGTVNFSHLGSIPAKFVAPASDGNVNRVYDNGYVLADGPRANEVDANGNQISAPGGRYPIYTILNDGSKIQTGEGLGYEQGLSREWQEYTQAQLDARPGYVALTNYSAASEGGYFQNETGITPGVEMEYSRTFGRLSRRIQWGLTTGLALSSISSQTSGAVTSTLNSHTDYYLIHGTLPDMPVGGHLMPSNDPYIVDSVIVNDAGLETTVPVSQTPDANSTDASTPGGATVNGRWTIKGAYFMMKFGPSLHAQFTDNWEMTASAGFAGAYAGSTYTGAETFTVADLPEGAVAGVQDIQQSNATAFLMGYYADLTIEWSANERTALFGGVSAQSLSDYDQTLSNTGQMARIDLGTAVGVRGGISIRF